MSQVAEEQDPAVDVEEQFESSRRFLDEWLIQLRDPSCCGERNATASQHSFQACHVRAEIHYLTRGTLKPGNMADDLVPLYQAPDVGRDWTRSGQRVKYAGWGHASGAGQSDGSATDLQHGFHKAGNSACVPNQRH